MDLQNSLPTDSVDEINASSGGDWIVEQELDYKLIRKQVMPSSGNTLEAVGLVLLYQLLRQLLGDRPGDRILG